MTSNIKPFKRAGPIQMSANIGEFPERTSATLGTRIIIVRYNNP